MPKGPDDISVVELFAGVGGFRCGLNLASETERFKTVWANQWEPGRKAQHAFDCYVHHFGKSDIHVNEDITKENVKAMIPEHDLLVGGFPCQDYSVARTQAKGIEGKKGVLWWHIKDIIEKRKPKYILLENVDRLIRSPRNQRGRDFAIMLRSLCDLGYGVEWRVINAAEYGEVQRRRRVFIFGFKKSTPFFKEMKKLPHEKVMCYDGFFAKIFPIYDFVACRSLTESLNLETATNRCYSFSIDAKEYATLADVSDTFARRFYNAGLMIDGNVYTGQGSPKFDGEPRTLSSIMEDSVDSKYEIKNLKKWKYMKGPKSEPRVNKKNGAEYMYSEGKISFPDSTDKPGRTMLTSEGKMNRSTHVVKDKTSGKYRLLTPLECERLNGFDDGWTDCLPESYRYFTMGNALVVPLVKKMGERIIELIDKNNLRT